MALHKLTSSQFVPAEWTAFLKEFQTKVSPGAVIVGGALRDLYLGRPVKDLDVVVPCSAWLGVIEIRLDLMDTIATLRPVFPEEYGVENSDPHLVAVYELTRLPGLPPVQLLWTDGLPTLEDQLNRLDFGICQIGYDGESVYCTNAFVKDVARLTFTLVSAHSRQRSLKRFERLSVKYPEYALVA